MECDTTDMGNTEGNSSPNDDYEDLDEGLLDDEENGDGEENGSGGVSYEITQNNTSDTSDDDESENTEVKVENKRSDDQETDEYEKKPDVSVSVENAVNEYVDPESPKSNIYPVKLEKVEVKPEDNAVNSVEETNDDFECPLDECPCKTENCSAFGTKDKIVHECALVLLSLMDRLNAEEEQDKIRDLEISKQNKLQEEQAEKERKQKLLTELEEAKKKTKELERRIKIENDSDSMKEEGNRPIEIEDNLEVKVEETTEIKMEQAVQSQKEDTNEQKQHKKKFRGIRKKPSKIPDKSKKNLHSDKMTNDQPPAEIPKEKKKKVDPRKTGPGKYVETHVSLIELSSGEEDDKESGDPKIRKETIITVKKFVKDPPKPIVVKESPEVKVVQPSGKRKNSDVATEATAAQPSEVKRTKIEKDPSDGNSTDGGQQKETYSPPVEQISPASTPRESGSTADNAIVVADSFLDDKLVLRNKRRLKLPRPQKGVQTLETRIILDENENLNANQMNESVQTEATRTTLLKEGSSQTATPTPHHEGCIVLNFDKNSMSLPRPSWNLFILEVVKEFDFYRQQQVIADQHRQYQQHQQMHNYHHAMQYQMQLNRMGPPQYPSVPMRRPNVNQLVERQSDPGSRLPIRHNRTSVKQIPRIFGQFPSQGYLPQPTPPVDYVRPRSSAAGNQGNVPSNQYPSGMDGGNRDQQTSVQNPQDAHMYDKEPQQQQQFVSGDTQSSNMQPDSQESMDTDDRDGDNSLTSSGQNDDRNMTNFMDLNAQERQELLVHSAERDMDVSDMDTTQPISKRTRSGVQVGLPRTNKGRKPKKTKNNPYGVSPDVLASQKSMLDNFNLLKHSAPQNQYSTQGRRAVSAAAGSEAQLQNVPIATKHVYAQNPQHSQKSHQQIGGPMISGFAADNDGYQDDTIDTSENVSSQQPQFNSCRPTTTTSTSMDLVDHDDELYNESATAESSADLSQPNLNLHLDESNTSNKSVTSAEQAVAKMSIDNEVAQDMNKGKEKVADHETTVENPNEQSVPKPTGQVPSQPNVKAGKQKKPFTTVVTKATKTKEDLKQGVKEAKVRAVEMGKLKDMKDMVRVYTHEDMRMFNEEKKNLAQVKTMLEKQRVQLRMAEANSLLVDFGRSCLQTKSDANAFMHAVARQTGNYPGGKDLRKAVIKYMTDNIGQYAYIVAHQANANFKDYVKRIANVQKETCDEIQVIACAQYLDRNITLVAPEVIWRYDENKPDDILVVLCSKTIMWAVKPADSDEEFENISPPKKQLFYKCWMCNKRFISLAILNHHKKGHKRKRYPCTECRRVFASSRSMKQHVEVQHEGKLYECDYVDCGKSFETKQSLKNHRAMHELRYTYVCELCSKGFMKKDHFEVHLLRHTQEKPFQCEICNTCFYRKQDIRRHLKKSCRNPKRKAIQCPLCGRYFKNSDTLRKHRKTVHEEGCIFKCTLCDDCTSRHSITVDRHMKAIHKVSYYQQ